MNRVVGRIVLDVVGTIVVALLLLGLWQGLLGGDTAAGFAEGARLLFLFMDVGLAVWVILLIVFAIRRRPAGVGGTVLFSLIGAVANLVVVIVVGIIQQGWAPLFIAFALEAGVAFMVAVFVVTMLVHRVLLPARD